MIFFQKLWIAWNTILFFRVFSLSYGSEALLSFRHRVVSVYVNFWWFVQDTFYLYLAKLCLWNKNQFWLLSGISEALVYWLSTFEFSLFMTAFLLTNLSRMSIDFLGFQTWALWVQVFASCFIPHFSISPLCKYYPSRLSLLLDLH